MDLHSFRNIGKVGSIIADPFEIVEIGTPEDLAEALGIDPADVLARMQEAVQ